jgi:hypothetical protein
VVGVCSRLRLARVGGRLSPRGNHHARPRARQRSHDVFAKAPSASEPVIARTYEVFLQIMRLHELGKGGMGVLAAETSTRRRPSIAARKTSCEAAGSPKVA